MTLPISKPEDLLFSPAEATRAGLKNLQQRVQNRDLAVPFGLPSVDKDYLPLLSGELETIIARPGHGKTGVMIHRARQRANYLAEHHPDRVVVYVTCEQTIEELWAFGIAAQSEVNISQMAKGDINHDEWLAIETSAVIGGAFPLWFIGPSNERRKKRPRVTVSAIIDTLFYLEDTVEKKIDICFVDYLQLVKPETTAENKAVSMGNIMEALKDGALHTGCGWSVGVQARREVDSRDLQIPGLDDGQWTSTIEQYSDKVWSLVRPCKYRKQGEAFGSQTVKGHAQILFSLLKQKLGKDNTSYWAYFDPAYNRLHELEQRYQIRDE